MKSRQIGRTAVHANELGFGGFADVVLLGTTTYCAAVPKGR